MRPSSIARCFACRWWASLASSSWCTSLPWHAFWLKCWSHSRACKRGGVYSPCFFSSLFLSSYVVLIIRAGQVVNAIEQSRSDDEPVHQRQRETWIAACHHHHPGRGGVRGRSLERGPAVLRRRSDPQGAAVANPDQTRPDHCSLHLQGCAGWLTIKKFCD